MLSSVVTCRSFSKLSLGSWCKLYIPPNSGQQYTKFFISHTWENPAPHANMRFVRYRSYKLSSSGFWERCQKLNKYIEKMLGRKTHEVVTSAADPIENNRVLSSFAGGPKIKVNFKEANDSSGGKGKEGATPQEHGKAPGNAGQPSQPPKTDQGLQAKPSEQAAGLTEAQPPLSTQGNQALPHKERRSEPFSMGVPQGVQSNPPPAAPQPPVGLKETQPSLTTQAVASNPALPKSEPFSMGVPNAGPQVPQSVPTAEQSVPSPQVVPPGAPAASTPQSQGDASPQSEGTADGSANQGLPEKPTIPKQEIRSKEELVVLIKELHDRIQDYEEKLLRAQSRLPFEEMSMHEFCDMVRVGPLQNEDGSGSFWPHTEEEQKPGAFGIKEADMEAIQAKPLITKEDMEKFEKEMTAKMRDEDGTHAAGVHPPEEPSKSTEKGPNETDKQSAEKK